MLIMRRFYMFQEIIEKTEKIIKKNWIKSLYHGTGGIGITFEKLLNIETNTLEIPDYNQIEIKTKLNNNKGYITLFSATPDSYLFEIKRIQQLYGYPDSKQPKYKVFNLSFYYNKKTYISKSLYGKLNIDEKNKNISLLIFNKLDNLIDSDCSWSFDLIKEKIERKIKFLFLVYAEQQIIKNEVYYKYINYHCYTFKSFEHFIENFKNGFLRITFKIGVVREGEKAGCIKDHGTSFDIDYSKIEKIFNKA
ncbi:MAG: hypothetical protein E7165_03695 [Firmicutes bacterium]|nr:hypothetical protein [Bacillota bacterium]